MSRGATFDPVCENQSSGIAAIPSLITAVSVAYNPICRQFTGTQTAIPDLPPTR